MILLDTNVLIYAANADAPQHAASLAVLHASFDKRVPGVLVTQVLLEFFSVMSHPRRMREPLSSERAWEEVAALRARLPIFEPRPAAMVELGELLSIRPVIGPLIFDLFLVAQMRVHGIATLCTFNTGDFAGIPGIEAVTPSDILNRFGLPSL